MPLRALDLFCGAGGSTKGLQRAGFHVTGIDLKASPRYCGDHFVRLDALYPSADCLRSFAFVWASPPCQAHTSLKAAHNAKSHVDLIPQTRELLRASGVPYVIENVPGAPLINPIKLRGTMFGLGAAGAQLIRERHFETSFPIENLPIDAFDASKPVIGIYGGHVRNRKRPPGKDHEPLSDYSIADGQKAMGIDWMNLMEMSQAIPPAYSEWIARQWIDMRLTARLRAPA